MFLKIFAEKSLLNISECVRDGTDVRRARQYNRHEYSNTRLRAEKYNKNTEFYFGKSDNHLHKDRGGRKTPFEIFLEDDGPYSRHWTDSFPIIQSINFTY